MEKDQEINEKHRKRTESDMDLDQSGAENDSPNDALARQQQRALGGGGGSKAVHSA